MQPDSHGASGGSGGSRLEDPELSARVLGAAIQVHRVLGPGLLESAYQACLAHELAVRGLRFRTEVAVPVIYGGIELECGYRVDFLVEEALVVELKSVERLLAIHEAQVITYLKLLDIRFGLLLNFNVILMKDGIRRLAYRAHR